MNFLERFLSTLFGGAIQATDPSRIRQGNSGFSCAVNFRLP
jgi:hypothetical protein